MWSYRPCLCCGIDIIPYGTGLEVYLVSTKISIHLCGTTPCCVGTKFCHCYVQYSCARQTHEIHEQNKDVEIRSKDCFLQRKRTQVVNVAYASSYSAYTSSTVSVFCNFLCTDQANTEHR